MKTLVRIGAIAFAGIAITMAALGMRDAAQGAPETLTSARIPRQADALRGELLRCQAIGQAGAGDALCLRVWAENRRRFLGLAGRQKASPPDPAVAAGTERPARVTPAATPHAVAAH